MASTTKLTPKGRVSFPEVYTPTSMNESSKKKYSVILLFDPAEIAKDPEQQALFKDMIDEANASSMELFKVPIGGIYKGKPIPSPFRKSEEKPNLYPPGLVFVKFSSINKPGVVDAAVQVISEESGAFYSGCYARVSYSVYSYDEGVRGVSFGLTNVQKLHDGERIGGKRTTPDEDFTAVAAAPMADAIPF